ncbi:MAG: scyllo-inositol 2-dehydrogenase, partial [Caballeronia sp.]|nr:scyllo-inositol 2-dehydrogenase [Caballeronia sp.]
MTALLKVGLMGYGFAGETFHAPVIDHCGRATVSAIATGKP